MIIPEQIKRKPMIDFIQYGIWVENEIDLRLSQEWDIDANYADIMLYSLVGEYPHYRRDLSKKMEEHIWYHVLDKYRKAGWKVDFLEVGHTKYARFTLPRKLRV